MVTKADNELMTRVEGSAPMGRMLRENYWIPFSRSAALKPGDAPTGVRLFGENFVAFRSTDGKVGLLDERCPHRGVSLLLARNEGCVLRCIFHGWAFDPAGNVVDVPIEAANAKAFAARVPMRRYTVVEKGGLAWAWLGSGEAPVMPDLPFFGLPEEDIWVSRTICKSNWLQGVEGALDSVHINFLHLSWGRKLESVTKTDTAYTEAVTNNATVKYEVLPTPYGLRAGAMRGQPDGNIYLRVTEWFAPFQSCVPLLNSHDGLYFAAVPMDDTSHMLFMLEYSPAGRVLEPTGGIAGEAGYDLDNFANIDGTRENRWGQDRMAMHEEDHFSGFTKNAIMEDVVVQLSMGPIADRTREYLCSSDLLIVRARKLLVEAVKNYESGTLPPGSALAGPVPIPTPVNATMPAGAAWSRFADETIAKEARPYAIA